MARQQCQACRGIFDTVGADGLQYFHVCPPLSTVELQAAVDSGRVVLPKDETVDDAVLRRVYHRTGHRDENVVAAPDPTAPATPKSLGKGVVELPPVAVDPVIVVPDA